MKKAVFAPLLACASLAIFLVTASAQVTIKDQAEYNQYTNAISQTDPKAKAAAIEGFLQAYPQSVVKEDMLQTLVLTYYQAQDAVKATDAADRLLQVNPKSLRGLTFEVFLRTAQAGSQTDPTQKQAMLDSAVPFAQRGLQATPPTGADPTASAAFKALKDQATPTFYGAMQRRTTTLQSRIFCWNCRPCR